MKASVQRSAPPSVVYVPISAMVPEAIAREAHARIGKRDWSQFVARALARELVWKARNAYIASASENMIDQDVYREFIVLPGS